MRRSSGPSTGREEDALAREDARHVAAEQRHERDQDGAEDGDLEPALQHLEPLPAQQRVEEVDRRRARRRSGRGGRRRSYAVEQLDQGRERGEGQRRPVRRRESMPSMRATAAVKAHTEPRSRAYRFRKDAYAVEAVADARVGADVARAAARSILRRRLAMCDAQHLHVVGVLRAPDLDQQRAVGQQPPAVARPARAAGRTRSASGGPPRRRRARCGRRGRARARRPRAPAPTPPGSARRSAACRRATSSRGAERLGHVVVGAGLQRAHLLVLLADRARARGSASASTRAGARRPRRRRRRAARGRRSPPPAGAARPGRAPPRRSRPGAPRSRRRAG